MMQPSITDGSVSAADIGSMSVLRRTIRDLLFEGIIGIGLGLSAVWTILLGYGVVKLVELVI